jgi:hypothetical protein
MAIDTKPNLSDSKFEQFSGDTLSLSGLTEIFGEMQVRDGGVIDSHTGYQICGETLFNCKNSSIMVGTDRLSGQTVGNNNLTFGGGNLTTLIASDCNVAIGFNNMSLLSGSTLTSCNIAIGVNNMSVADFGLENVVLGYDNLISISGYNNNNRNVVIGAKIMQGKPQSTGDVAIGYKVMCCDVTAEYTPKNVSIGYLAVSEACKVSNTTAIGYGAGGGIIGTSCLNTMIGTCALYSNNTTLSTSIAQNTAIGVLSLANLSNGTFNVAVGSCAGRGFSAYTASCNIAIGGCSMNNITGGGNNIGVGFGTLFNNDSGINNIATGYQALYYNETGSNNIAMGCRAMFNNETGDYNIALGCNTMYSNVNGSQNISLGERAMQNATGGTYNIALGSASLYCNATGEDNIALGTNAMSNNDSGCRNIGIGYYSLQNNVTGKNNFAGGPSALRNITTGNSNIGIGSLGGYGIETGIHNVSMGTNSMYFNEIGSCNIALGLCALRLSGGTNNIGIGSLTFQSNGFGDRNIAIGEKAMTGGDGSCNVAIGYCAGASVTGDTNIFIGYRAGLLETGSNKLYIDMGDYITPLIYGEFDNNLLRINGDLEVSGCAKIEGLPAKSTETCGLYIDASGNLSTGVVSSGGTTSASGENITKEITQTSHGFGVQDFIGWSGGTYNLAIADGSYDGEFIGLVSCVPDVNTFCVTQAGYVEGLTGLVANTTYFLSPTTSGLITATEPSGNGEISKAVLLANSTTSGWVLPYIGYVISTGSTSVSTAANGLTDNGGIVELGGSLCRDTDIDVNSYSLSISGLAGKTTETNAIFVGADGTLVTGTTSSGCGVYTSNSPATCTVGGISAGTVLTGQTLEYLLQEILAPYIEPTFSAFNAVITSPMEVGTALNGNKTFTWSTTTSANVATNSIGICEVGGSLLGSGLANDGSELLNIGIKTNTSPTTWTWQITGCSTQDNDFSRNVSKCSIYPYFWGVETCGTRPDVTNSLVTGGTKVVSAVGSSVSVTFNSSGQWTWIAIQCDYAPRTKWFQGAAPNCGDINNLPTDKYPDECLISISSGQGYWSGICYRVYMSGSAATDGSTPIQFRTY